MQPIADEDAAWRSHLDDAPHQFGRSRSIEWDDSDTAQHAPPERCDPFGPAVAPDQQPIAGSQPRIRQPTGERLRRRAHVIARIRPSPESVVVNERFGVPSNVAIEEVDEVFHDGSESNLNAATALSSAHTRRAATWPDACIIHSA